MWPGGSPRTNGPGSCGIWTPCPRNDMGKIMKRALPS
ncbi:hypothetical protein STENM223S_02604 [Streptomyces tendae]